MEGLCHLTQAIMFYRFVFHKNLFVIKNPTVRVDLQGNYSDIGKVQTSKAGIRCHLLAASADSFFNKAATA